MPCAVVQFVLVPFFMDKEGLIRVAVFVSSDPAGLYVQDSRRFFQLGCKKYNFPGCDIASVPEHS